MAEMISYVFSFIIEIIGIYKYILIASVIVSWLVAFDIINKRNEMVAKILYIIHRLTDPFLSLIRRFLPPIAGLDFSPVVAFFILQLLQIGVRQIGMFILGVIGY